MAITLQDYWKQHQNLGFGAAHAAVRMLNLVERKRREHPPAPPAPPVRPAVCQGCKWQLLDAHRCERGASPSYAAVLGKCAKHNLGWPT